jgi:hypothetical protein
MTTYTSHATTMQQYGDKTLCLQGQEGERQKRHEAVSLLHKVAVPALPAT